MLNINTRVQTTLMARVAPLLLIVIIATLQLAWPLVIGNPDTLGTILTSTAAALLLLSSAFPKYVILRISASVGVFGSVLAKIGYVSSPGAVNLGQMVVCIFVLVGIGLVSINWSSATNRLMITRMEAGNGGYST